MEATRTRTVVVEAYMLKDGTQKYAARWYCPHWTLCTPALLGDREFCKGHKKGTSGFDTKADAMVAGHRAQERAATATPTMAFADAASMTMNQLAHQWFESGQANFKSPRTERGYKDRWRAWTTRSPQIGLIPVSAVQPMHITQWLTELRVRGYSYSTMRQDLVVLRRILGFAVVNGLIDKNPAADANTPGSLKPTPGKQPRLSEAEVFRVADTIRSDLRTSVLVGMYTGLRLGELLGLRSGDIRRNRDPYVIHVGSQWDETVKEFRLPKRGKTRSVPLLPEMNRALDKHLLEYAPSDNHHGFVFASRSGTPILQSNFRRAWNRTIDHLGLPACRPHSLRATFVDLMIDRGVRADHVQAMAGHGTLGITMDVYHGDAAIDEIAAAILANPKTAPTRRDDDESGPALVVVS